MRNIKYAFLCMIILPLWPGIAMAEKPEDLQMLLKGDYRAAGSESCIQSVSGFSGAPYWFPCSSFDPATGPGPDCVPPVEYEVTVIAEYSFDGKGNAHSKFKSFVVVDSPFHFHAPDGSPAVGNFFLSGSDGECHYTYTVKPDRTFTMALNHCTGTQVVGGETGLSLYVGPVAGIQGFIAQGRQTMVTTTVDPAVQTITVGMDSSTRVCMTKTDYHRTWPNQGAEADSKQPEEAGNLDPRPWW